MNTLTLPHPNPEYFPDGWPKQWDLKVGETYQIDYISPPYMYLIRHNYTKFSIHQQWLTPGNSFINRRKIRRT